jgi:hypothetical protein
VVSSTYRGTILGLGEVKGLSGGDLDVLENDVGATTSAGGSLSSSGEGARRTSLNQFRGRGRGSSGERAERCETEKMEMHSERVSSDQQNA